jgi:hypothetical protein
MRRIRIGRNDDNDVVLNDATVSRYHAELLVQPDGSVSFIDLDSTNGSFVNGRRVNGTTSLGHNDIVKVGTSLLPWRKYLSPTSLSQQQSTRTFESDQVQDGYHNQGYQQITTQKKSNRAQVWLLLIVGVIVLVAIYFLFMQETDKSKFVGEWYINESQDVIIFSKDGNYYVEFKEMGKWEVKDNIIKIINKDLQEYKFKYSFTTKDRVTLTGDGFDSLLQLSRKL